MGILLVACYSCGSSSSSDNGSSTPTDHSIKGIAVDPYIVGAQLFEDLNGNGVQDADEQISTLSNSQGVLTFSSPLSITAILLLSDTSIAPFHNGVTYTGHVKRIVDATGTLVVSPLTTLLANGWTEIQIVDVLTTAGLTGITTDDLKLNPMAGMDSATTITEAELAKIRASIAIYSFMATMDLIIHNGYDISYTGFVNNADCTPTLKAMVDSINYCLSPTLLTTIQTDMSTAESHIPGGVTLPRVTVGDVIKASVAMANDLIPDVAAAPKTFTPNLGNLASMSYTLGLNFYLIRNKDNFYIKYGVDHALVPSDALTGILDMDTQTIINNILP
jgi:hypothetical protein